MWWCAASSFFQFYFFTFCLDFYRYRWFGVAYLWAVRRRERVSSSRAAAVVAPAEGVAVVDVLLVVVVVDRVVVVVVDRVVVVVDRVVVVVVAAEWPCEGR